MKERKKKKMGIMNHDAVIATTWNDKYFTLAREWVALRPDAKYFIHHDTPFVNSYRTIICLPDGSKEGWEKSEDGDKRRAEFIRFLESQKYDDGSSSWDYVEVSWGEFGASVKKTNCENKY